MIEYVYDGDDYLIDWALQHMPDRLQFRSDAHAIGLVIDSDIRAVTVFDNFSPTDCLVSVASDGSRRWFTREYARRTMIYPFVQLGFTRITCLISSHNEPSLRFTLKFGGWQHEGTLREAGEHGEPLVLFGMLRRDCRWLTEVERKGLSLLSPAMAV